jgi:hypothetical protein
LARSTPPSFALKVEDGKRCSKGQLLISHGSPENPPEVKVRKWEIGERAEFFFGLSYS